MTEPTPPQGGDWTLLLKLLEAEAFRLGIVLTSEARNPWDINLTASGESAAALLLALREVRHVPTQDDVARTVLTYVDGIDRIGG